MFANPVLINPGGNISAKMNWSRSQDFESINPQFLLYQELIWMNKILSGRLRDRKNKGTVQLSNP